MDMIGWLVAFVILIGIEAATMALTTIWFAGGAVFAFFAAVLEFSVQTQLVVFLIVSFVLLLFTRPLASTVRQPGDREDECGRADRKKGKSDQKNRQQ